MARLFDDRMITWIKTELKDATALFFAPVTGLARLLVRGCRSLTGHPERKSSSPWDHRRRSA